MKVCTNAECPSEGRPQPLSEFYKQASQKTGLTPQCKTCIKTKVGAYAKTPAGRATANKHGKKYRESAEGKAKKAELARLYNAREEIKKRSHNRYVARKAKEPPKVRPTIEERFWPKVSKTDGCWLWSAGKDRHGYGHFGIGGRGGRQVRAHRLAWELLKGPIPPGLCVLHRCDNPPCVNPDHLFLGTMKDNTQDMLAKGRHKYGSRWG